MLSRIRKSIHEKLDQGEALVPVSHHQQYVGRHRHPLPDQRKKDVDASMKSDPMSVATKIDSYSVDRQTYPPLVMLTRWYLSDNGGLQLSGTGCTI